MSSSIHIKFDGDGLSFADFDDFIADYRLAASHGGGATSGQVELTAIEQDGHIKQAVFSTYHLGEEMPRVAMLARAFWQRFGGSVDASPELRPLFAAVGQ
jgi:hypothetical protein